MNASMVGTARFASGAATAVTARKARGTARGTTSNYARCAAKHGADSANSNNREK